LLSLLLTGTPGKAEECFIEGIGESTKGNYVFKEWARSWARRTIIQSAIRLIAPMDYSPTISRSADVARGMDKIPLILHAEVRAILELAPLERFVFVMSVLERYSDNDCSILLGYARREIVPLRIRAMQQLGMFLRSKYPMESSSENPTAMMTRVSVNAGFLMNCQTARGMLERYGSSGRNFSVFELIWTTKCERNSEQS